MKVRDLIAALQKTDQDAFVVFNPEGEDPPVDIEGGIISARRGEPVLVLAPLTLSGLPGGF